MTLCFYDLERLTVKLEMRGHPPRPDERGFKNGDSTALRSRLTGTRKKYIRETHFKFVYIFHNDFERIVENMLDCLRILVMI